MDLEVQKESPKPEQEKALKEGFLDAETGLNPRSKTSLRMIYDAQVSVIQKQIGDLEKIRTDLGLSQRKMCQLLMVDPSAWTRWNRKDEQAPPHIWRSLQWYLTLQEKIPGLTPQYFIGKDPQILHEKTMSEVAALKASLQREIRFHRRISYFTAALMLILGTALILSGKLGL